MRRSLAGVLAAFLAASFCASAGAQDLQSGFDRLRRSVASKVTRSCPHSGCNFVVHEKPSVADEWVQRHIRAVHGGSGSGGGGGYQGGGSLEETATRAMVEGIQRRDANLFAMGAGAMIFKGFMDGLFSADSGPSAEEIEAARRAREEAERRRLEEIARLEEMARKARFEHAAELRADWDERERARSGELSDVLAVIQPRRSTAFFGIEGNPPPEEVAAALADANPWDAFFDGRGANAPPEVRVGQSLEYRARLPMGPSYSSDVVALTSDQVMVAPEFIGDAQIRAAETAAFEAGLRRFDPVPDPRTRWSGPSPYAEARRNIKGWFVGDLRDAAVDQLTERTGAPLGGPLAVKNLADRLFAELGDLDLRNPDVERWGRLPGELGRQFLREAWGDPTLRLEEVAERLKMIRQMAGDIVTYERGRLGEFRERVEEMVGKMKIERPDWDRPKRHIKEGVVLGLMTDQRDADKILREGIVPFEKNRESYAELHKRGRALAISFGAGESEAAREAGRGIVDHVTLAGATLGSENGQRLMRTLQGTKIDRIMAHSNGATVTEALIRGDVIKVDEFHIAGGDRSLISGPSLQELLDTGKVKKVVVWVNPGDPIPAATATLPSMAIEGMRHVQQEALNRVSGTPSHGGGAKVEYRFLKGPQYLGQEFSTEAHEQKTYSENIRRSTVLSK